jgi:hypothetical protein
MTLGTNRKAVGRTGPERAAIKVNAVGNVNKVDSVHNVIV